MLHKLYLNFFSNSPNSSKKQYLIRYLLKNTKNVMFNDFFLNFFVKKSNWLFTDVNTPSLTVSKSRTMWENYISYRHYCSEQLYLDNLINQSKYFAAIKKKNYINRSLII